MANDHKASEKLLSKLHGDVAEVLSESILYQEDETEIDSDGEIVLTGQKRYTVSPAMMGQAVKFLKDNSITSDIKVDKNMSKLEEALAKKQKHSRLTNPVDAAQEERAH